MDNPIRPLRDALRLTQIQLANALGWSYGSVQAYERGANIPDERLEQLKTFAVQKGCADIALAMSGEKWRVQTVLYPMIPPPPSTHSKPPAGLEDRRTQMHTLVDEIVDSGQQDAIDAIEGNLLVFVDRVRLRRPAAQPIRKSRQK